MNGKRNIVNGCEECRKHLVLRYISGNVINYSTKDINRLIIKSKVYEQVGIYTR